MVVKSPRTCSLLLYERCVCLNSALFLVLCTSEIGDRVSTPGNMSSSAEELGSTDVGNVKTSVRLHRTGSIEAIVGGHHHLLGSGIGQSAAEGLVQKDATTPPSPMGSQVLSETPHNPVRELHGPEKPSPSLRASHLMRASTHSYSPGFKAAHNYGTSTFSRSLLATATQSSNLHNSRAVLSALRALQDKIHRLEVSVPHFPPPEKIQPNVYTPKSVPPSAHPFAVLRSYRLCFLFFSF